MTAQEFIKKYKGQIVYINGPTAEPPWRDRYGMVLNEYRDDVVVLVNDDSPEGNRGRCFPVGWLSVQEIDKAPLPLPG